MVEAGHVNIWLAEISALCQDNKHCNSILSACGGVVKGTPEFIAGRRLLSHCIGFDALKTLRQTSQGKPYFSDLSLPQFNISHSGDQIVLAVTPKYQIGIDIEMIRTRNQRASLIANYFNDEEKKEILTEKNEQRELALFWEYWTNHESIIKQKDQSVWKIKPSDTLVSSLSEQNLALSVWYTEQSVISLCCHNKLVVNEPINIVI